MLDIISREDARSNGLKHFFTGEPCVNGHVERRYVVSGACHKCNLEKSRRFRERNPDLCAERVAAAKAKNPDYFKQYYSRNRAKRKVDANQWYHANSKHALEVCKRWVRANPDKVRRIGRVSARNRRARLAGVGGSHTQADLKRIYAKQAGKCAICKCSLSRAIREVDHIMPIALGGHNGPDNLQYLCRPCNRAKGAKHPDDVAKERGMLS